VPEDSPDVIVVGAGNAGLSAAHAAREGRGSGALAFSADGSVVARCVYGAPSYHA
jgi:cation diffusion facilitator CzcD-associated flavoprotein CzcO